MNKASSKHTSSNRLFFALWPEEKVRASISSSLEQFPAYTDGSVSGRPVPLYNLHLTLHFLGQVSEGEQVCMHHAAQSINAEQFTLQLDRYGTFPRAKVFWFGPDADQDVLPQALSDLHRDLGEALENCGYHTEDRPYTPHITLLRKCRIDETRSLEKSSGESIWQADSSITWRVKEFVLVRSVPTSIGVKYQVIEKYPLS
jgi:2'-5' RNA ligase